MRVNKPLQLKLVPPKLNPAIPSFGRIYKWHFFGLKFGLNRFSKVYFNRNRGRLRTVISKTAPFGVNYETAFCSQTKAQQIRLREKNKIANRK